MNLLYYLLLFVVGAALGSFANVLILRYDPDRNVFSGPSLAGRSHCMHCARALAWYELVPIVSFLALRGRCRTCRATLTVQYPLVEFAGGFITAGIPWFLSSFFGMSFVLLFAGTAPFWFYGVCVSWIIIFFILLLITVIDLRHYLIPNELTLLLVLAGAMNSVIMAMRPGGLGSSSLFSNSFLQQYVLLFSPFQGIVANHILGAVVGVGFFWALYQVTKGRGIGFGDVKLAGALGLVLGWPDIGLAILLSFIIGGLVGAALMAWGRRGMRDRVPFAPFLVLGFTLTVFFGSRILDAYFGVFAR